METGFIIKFGTLVPGREPQAIDLFADTKAFFAEWYEKGYVTYYEPYFYGTGDFEAQVGFWLVKGEQEKLWKLFQEEHFQWLMAKAQFVVEHLEVDWLMVGDQIDEIVERGLKLAAEFAVTH